MRISGSYFCQATRGGTRHQYFLALYTCLMSRRELLILTHDWSQLEVKLTLMIADEIFVIRNQVSVSSLVMSTFCLLSRSASYSVCVCVCRCVCGCVCGGCVCVWGCV